MRALLTLTLAVLALGLPGQAIAKDKKTKKQPPPLPVAETPLPGSSLTASEQALDCKRMAGRMQIRILELRGGGAKSPASTTASGMQSALTTVFGGTRRGADVAADTATDIAKLKEMNALLIARKCPYYDLDAELAKPREAPSPRLVRAAQAKPGTKPAARPGAKPVKKKPAAAARKPAKPH